MAASKPDVKPTREERRARRAARREKQRQENAGRAAKMHAARLAWEREAKATKPGDAEKRGETEFHVGCSGWFYWGWRGKFYPANLPTSRWFHHYAQRFETVELNAPFYSWPTVGTVRSWTRQAGRRNFVYTVKVSELITHVRSFVRTKTLIRDFGHIADLLGPRMGCFLFQLPPQFHYSRARLERIVSQLDPRRRNVVEFRHSSWWNKDVFAAFRRAGIIFCSCSAPRLPDELVVTTGDLYLRFHGTERWYRHDYSADELAAWVKKIRASGAKRIWAYFNNDYNGFALKNARALLRQLRSAHDFKAGPPELNSRPARVPFSSAGRRGNTTRRPAPAR
jgi:uncharacterized protein YecE (DUF72 family)